MINEEVLEQIEKALDIKLYDWQRNYLLDKRVEIPRRRHCGYTLATIIKLLLTKEMREQEIRQIAPYGRIDGRIFYERWAIEIDDKLKAAGIKTKLIRRGGINDAI